MSGLHGQRGWREFHRKRKDILDEFDKAYELTVSRPVRTAHGVSVEAYIRKWLAEFLPKKFAVTSGYIVPNLYMDDGNLYHFDIIIYNAMEAPVLWTESNEDSSESGKFRAIPAKYVYAVIEVKSKLSKSTIQEALKKLDQVKEFADQLDKYFSSWVIFVDLEQSKVNKDDILPELLQGASTPKFSGGMVLRFEGDPSITGLISLSKVEEQCSKEEKQILPLAKPIDDLNIYQNEDGSLAVSEQGAGLMLMVTAPGTWSFTKMYGGQFQKNGYLVMLNWSRTNFSEFCIGLLACLEGMPFNDPKRHSFGRVFDGAEMRSAPDQRSDPVSGMPFLTFELSGGDNSGSDFEICEIDESPVVKFEVVVKNIGDAAAEFSDDGFKTTIEIIPGNSCKKQMLFSAAGQGKSIIDKINSDLNGDGLSIKYRGVYRLNVDGGRKLFAVACHFNVTRGEAIIKRT